MKSRFNNHKGQSQYVYVPAPAPAPAAIVVRVKMESAERTMHGRVNLAKAVRDLQRKLRSSTSVKQQHVPFDVNRPSTSINIRPITAPSSVELKHGNGRQQKKGGVYSGASPGRAKREKFIVQVYTLPFTTDHYRNVRYGQDLYLKQNERYHKPVGARVTSAQIIERLERVTSPPGYMGNRDDIRHDTTKTDRAAISMTANERLLRKLTGVMFDDKLADYIADARPASRSAEHRKTTIRFKD